MADNSELCDIPNKIKVLWSAQITLDHWRSHLVDVRGIEAVDFAVGSIIWKHSEENVHLNIINIIIYSKLFKVALNLMVFKSL